MKQYTTDLLGRTLSKLLLCSICLIMVACSTTTGPVIIRDVDTSLPPNEPMIENTDQGGVSQGNAAEVEVGKVPERIIVQPVAPSRPVPNSPLKIKLIRQAEKNLSDKSYQAAIAIAERGLRVDRKEPRFYQVLAAAYSGLGNRQQSAQFAKQGLRYAPKASAIHQSLSRWLR